MVEMPFRPEKVNVVRGDEPDAKFAAEALGFPQSATVAGREMLHFDVEAVGEYVLQL
jgi:hypothetical protein